MGMDALCRLLHEHPELRYDKVIISSNGRIEVAATGENGVLMSWCRALPEHHMHPGLVPAMWGLTEADVIEGDGITVTVKRPLATPGAR